MSTELALGASNQPVPKSVRFDRRHPPVNVSWEEYTRSKRVDNILRIRKDGLDKLTNSPPSLVSLLVSDPD